MWSMGFGLTTKGVWPWLVGDGWEGDGWEGDGGEGVGGVGSSIQAVEFSHATRLAIVQERADP